MELGEKSKKIVKQLAILHPLEALVAYRAAKNRGLNPKRYFLLTTVFGVFVLVPLLRKPKPEKKSVKVDI